MTRSQADPEPTINRRLRGSNARVLWLFGALLSIALPDRALTQPSTFVSRVVNGSNEQPIVGARVELRNLKMAAETDSNGIYSIRGIVQGTHAVMVRAIGFDFVAAKLQFAAGSLLESDFLMSALVTSLPALRVGASAREPNGWRLREFDERRALGLGRFLDQSFFEQHQDLSVRALLSCRIPGVRTKKVRGLEVLISSHNGKPYSPQTILNGIVREDLDLNLLFTSDIIGVEYHAVGSTPVRYNISGTAAGGAQCGTAIFWTK